MKTVFALVAVALLLAQSTYAFQSQQTKGSLNSQSNAEAKAKDGNVTLEAGSQIEAEMASQLDLKKAKPGDKFKMKASRPVKQDGKEVISRDSIITGHIEQITRADNLTKATLVFDEITDKKTGATTSIEAVVTSIVKAERRAQSMSDDDMSPPPPPRASTQSGGLVGGGLVGGVVNTVGGVTGQVDATSGSDAGLGGITRSPIQIVTETTTNISSGSTLSVAGRNSKIESGTRFLLKTTSALTITREKKEKAEP